MIVTRTFRSDLRLVFEWMVEVRKLRPEVGFEPTTFGLLVRRSPNWATLASFRISTIHSKTSCKSVLNHIEGRLTPHLYIIFIFRHRILSTTSPLFIWERKFNKLFSFSGTGFCPLLHPYSFGRGSYCCQENKEKSSNQETCSGREISYQSSCCLNDLYVDCKYKSCQNSGKFTPSPWIFFKIRNRCIRR